MPRPAPTPERDRARWLSYVDTSGGPDACHPWTASKAPSGYGNFTLQGKGRTRAHRSGWQLFVGPIPTGMLVCHTCDNPACCNRRHWFLGTHQENMLDKARKGRAASTRPPLHRGELHPQAKLTAADVAEIRASYTGRHGEKRQLARRFGVSGTQIGKILSGRIWAVPH